MSISKTPTLVKKNEEIPVTPPISHERFNFSFSFFRGTAFADGL